MRRNGVSIEKYPVCHAGHRIIDGLIGLRQAHQIRPEQVVRIVPTLSAVNVRVLRSHRPLTALEAKFSIAFECARSICEGAIGLAQVADAQVQRDDIQRLMNLVRPETVEAGCAIEPGFALHDRVLDRLAWGVRGSAGAKPILGFIDRRGPRLLSRMSPRQGTVTLRSCT